MIKFNINYLILSLAIYFFGLCFLYPGYIQSSTSEKVPNIIFLLVDDMGYGEPGVFPSTSPHGRIATPNIDRLAEEGLMFTNAYAGAPVCSPSRCSLMTGLHTGHTPIRGNKKAGPNRTDFPLPENYTTIAQILQKHAGYDTALIGKWGLGYVTTTGEPLSKGFDYYFGQLDSCHCHDYYPTFMFENRTKINYPNNKDASPKRCMKPNNTCTYSNTEFWDKAFDWLNNHAINKKDTPFFLYLSPTIPHAGGYLGGYETGSPVPSTAPYSFESWPEIEKGHAAMITTWEDRYIGQLLDLMKKLDVEKDTVLFFASDNGAMNEGGHNYMFFNSSGPLRGYKRSLYEGGIRQPGIVRWPGHVESNTSSDYAWYFADFMATAAELAGIDPTYLPKNDGISIVPTMLGKIQPPKDYLYWEFCTSDNDYDGKKGWGRALRQEDWKIVSFHEDEQWQLYDLSTDIHENNNVAKLHPDVVSSLGKLAEEAHTNDPNWPKGKECDSSLSSAQTIKRDHVIDC